MGIDAIIVIVVIAGALVLFISEWLPIDLVSILIMVTLIASGVITPEQGVAGFSNPATITIAAMFVVSSALIKTGVVNFIAYSLARMIKQNLNRGIGAMMLSVGSISAFINNTPVVAVFIPLVVKAAAKAKKSVSKLLIPLSFASIFGGTCTLIGTSTNLLVSGIAEENGLEGFSMFEMTPIGLIFFVTGVLYMYFFGIKMLPDRNGMGMDDLTNKFGLKNYLTEIVLLKDANSVGKKIMDSPLVKELEMDIIEIQRDSGTFTLPPIDMYLMAGDRLKVRCNVEKLKELKDRIKVSFKPRIKIADNSMLASNTAMVELVITANSEFEGKTLNEVGFRRKYRAIPLAIRHKEGVTQENIKDTRLEAGDILLAEVKRHRLEEFKKYENQPRAPFLIISEEILPEYHRGKLITVMFVVLGIIVTATFNILPILVSALVGVCILVLTRCMNMQDVYEAIDWKVVFLLAGTLSLGTAMQTSGVSDMIAYSLKNHFGSFGPVAIVSGLYLFSSLLTAVMSNTATAALLAPVGIAIANVMGIDYTPLLMAIMFGASASFVTPVGYQTNTMIYSAGQYKFIDFIRAGSFINIMFWILATIFIPLIYGF